MEPGSFGEHLKRERELRGVTLDEISTATRIATRFLQAIENEQWERLPGGVFNRGFVRAVARYLGLDEEDILAEFGQAAGDRSNIPVWTGSPPAVTPDQPWLAWILAGVVVLTIAGGGWFAVKRIVAWRVARRAGLPPAPAVAAPSPPSSTLPQGASAEPFPPQTALPTTPSVPAPPDPPNPASVRATNSTSGAAVALELKIEAAKTTQVTVEADDKRIFDGPITGGENRTFRARLKFLVSADDSGALVLQLNGETLAPFGPPGRAGKIVLSRVSLKGAAGGRN